MPNPWTTAPQKPSTNVATSRHIVPLVTNDPGKRPYLNLPPTLLRTSLPLLCRPQNLMILSTLDLKLPARTYWQAHLFLYSLCTLLASSRSRTIRWQGPFPYPLMITEPTLNSTLPTLLVPYFSRVNTLLQKVEYSPVSTQKHP